VLSGNFTAAPIAVLLAPFGANSARFFTNAIDTRTNGVDVSANYLVALGASGDVQLRGGYNNTRTRVVGSIATPPQLADYSSVLFDRIEQRRIACAQPNDSLRVGSEWRRRRVAVNLNVARYGEYCSTVTLNPVDDQQYRPKWLTDLEASYRSAGYTLAVGAQNIFDVFPDRNTTVNSFNGIQTYPSLSPFGMNGRAIYARIGRTF
jgi:iron complex outermembrane receptor protein